MRAATSILALSMLLFAGTASAKKWPNKRPSTPELGKQVYEEKCGQCHGPKGAGDGPAAVALKAELPDFSKGLGQRSKEDMIRAVLRGKGLMPAYDLLLTREEAEAVVQHLTVVGKELTPAEKEAVERSKKKPEGEAGKPGADDAPAREAQPPE
jgi:mono/diheme cytochrome c family protein